MPIKPLKPCAQLGCPNMVQSGYCDKHKKRERYCKEPGCSALLTDGNYCNKHNPKRKHDKQRGSASSRGYDNRWARVRGAYLKAHPLCERCEAADLVEAAVMVHHILPIADGGERLKWSNLKSLCNNCHDKEHRELRKKKRENV